MAEKWLFLLFGAWQTTYANRGSSFGVREERGWAVFGERYVIRWISVANEAGGREIPIYDNLSVKAAILTG